MDSIEVGADVLRAVTDHARSEAPNECCGLLVGTSGCIERSVPTTNLAPSPTRYEVDPREHVALIRTLRGGSQSIVGAYHSHPHSPATPSATDIAEAFYPEFIHLIVSLADWMEPVIRGYRICNGNVEPVLLVPIP
jgi:proteasome lid subunit RPN8/RPN11